MNFLAVENFLNASNHTVRKVSILFIISIAFSENEIVITFYKDFVELIFKERLSLPSDIILSVKTFRPGKILLDEMENRHLILTGYFTVTSGIKSGKKD